METVSGTATMTTPAADATSPTVPRSERRREATDRKLMHATLQIAVERGISGVTIEEVARRSGVAKTTIYRRYHNSNELLRGISAMYLVNAEDELSPTLSPTREHFTVMLGKLVDWVRANNIDVRSVGIVLSSEAEFFHHIVDQVVTPWLGKLRNFLNLGAAEGVFRSGLDERLLLSTIIGSLVAYEAIDQHPADSDIAAWPQRMTDLLWPALLA
nr:TetR/AcrR family transcriptional regulator [Bifidobacterium felsineum]